MPIKICISLLITVLFMSCTRSVKKTIKIEESDTIVNVKKTLVDTLCSDTLVSTSELMNYMGTWICQGYSLKKDINPNDIVKDEFRGEAFAKEFSKYAYLNLRIDSVNNIFITAVDLFESEMRAYKKLDMCLSKKEKMLVINSNEKNICCNIFLLPIHLYYDVINDIDDIYSYKNSPINSLMLITKDQIMIESGFYIFNFRKDDSFVPNEQIKGIPGDYYNNFHVFKRYESTNLTDILQEFSSDFPLSGERLSKDSNAIKILSEEKNNNKELHISMEAIAADAFIVNISFHDNYSEIEYFIKYDYYDYYD